LDDRHRWLAHLHERGYVVISGVANASEVAAAKGLLWTDLERENPGLSRADPSTWGQWVWDLDERGVVANLAQSAGAWLVRGLSKVKRAFAAIWGTEHLLVSMDVVFVWRPWWTERTQPRTWLPVTEGLHLDQNPFDKPGLDCIQGMVPLLPVTEVTGGLKVVPFSHLGEAKAETKRRYPRWEGRGDWCRLGGSDPMQRCAILLCADPGDLILWDSRTVHGGHVGTGASPSKPVGLARMTCTVAMTPQANASLEVCRLRREGFERGLAFNHCPHVLSDTWLCQQRCANVAVLNTQQQLLLPAHDV